MSEPTIRVTETTKRRYPKIEGEPLTDEQRAEVQNLVDSVTHTKRRESFAEQAIRRAREKQTGGLE